LARGEFPVNEVGTEMNLSFNLIFGALAILSFVLLLWQFLAAKKESRVASNYLKGELTCAAPRA